MLTEDIKENMRPGFTKRMNLMSRSGWTFTRGVPGKQKGERMT